MTSFYQSLKIEIVNLLDMSKDAIHLHIGMFIFLASILILRRQRVSIIYLIPVFIVASIMEILDLSDDFRSLGHFNWANSLHDIINTCFWPVLIFLLLKYKKITVTKEQ